MPAHPSLLHTGMKAPSTTTQSLVDAISLKIQQGKEDVSPVELEQLQRFVLDDEKDSQCIPYLDRAYLQSGKICSDEQRVTLVHYQGMVQDMLDSEYYISEMNGMKTKYRDYCNSTEEENNIGGMEEVTKHLEERQPLVIVPVPFAYHRQVETDSNAEMAKEMQVENSSSSSNNSNAAASRNNKRSLEQNEDGVSSPARKQHQPVLIRDSPDSAAAAGAALPKNVDWWPAGCMGSDPNQCPVLAKLYYDEEEQVPLKLNQVVEMIGVLSLNPLDALQPEEDDDMMMMTDATTVLPPPSLLPRLHVLAYRPIDIYDAVEPKKKDAMETDNDDGDDGNDDRTYCIQTLSKAVFGDNDTAAEALLMVLLSMAERDKDGMPIQMTEDTTLGCASLKVVVENQDDCGVLQERLRTVLAQLVPVVASTSHNNILAAPQKSSSGRLEPSLLQLPKGAILLVKEQHALNSNCLAAVSSLTKSHMVPYVFEGGMAFNFEADVSAIVVSSTNSKALPCTMNMYIKDKLCATTEELSQNDCTRIRSYLQSCRSPSSNNNNIELGRNVLEVAQQDFCERRVQQRETNVKEATEQDFHRWLTLTRLQARSRVGNAATHCASCKDYKAAVHLDDAMRK